MISSYELKLMMEVLLMLSDDERIYFSRQIVLDGFGEDGQLKIKQARVLVAGIGGLGTTSCLLLAELGVGYLRVVDRDIIEHTNLHRTPLYTIADLDRAKVEVSAERLKQINPSMIVDTHACHIGEANIDELLEEIDIVIDGLDNFETRRIINQSCIRKGIPFVFCGVSARSGNITVFNLTESSPCLSCLYHGIDDDDLESCDITGIHPALLPIATGIQVYEAIKIIFNRKSSLDSSLLFIDLNNLNFDRISLRKNPNCPVCSKPSDYVEFAPETEFQPLELCGGTSVMIVPQIRIDLDMIDIKSKVMKKFKIIKSGTHAISFLLTEDINVTIFKGGNALIRGGTSKKEAMEVWESISKIIL
ncbi:MAG: ThiF family adenylyltransferase [Candidatus Hodarchaeota archaeon]